MVDDRPTVLLTYDRGAAGPVEIMRELADLADLVVLLRSGPDPLASFFLEQASCYFLDAEPLPDLIARLRRHNPAGVLTYSESMLAVTAQIAHQLHLRFHAPSTAEALTNKSVQRARLRAAGLDSTRSCLVAVEEDWPAAAAQVGLPCVLKPVRGEGSRNTHRVETMQQGAGIVAELFADSTSVPLVAEELLIGRDNEPFGDYVSVETLVVDGASQHLGVTGKLPLVAPFRETGAFWPSTLPVEEEAAIRELTSRALQALGVRDGICHTELKLTPTGPRIIEVNGRLGGFVQELVLRAGGINLLRVAADIALGRQRLPVPMSQVEQVSYQFSNLPPPNATRLLARSGGAEVSRLPGVHSYRAFYRPGDRLAGGVGTDELDLLRGAAADHLSMLAVIRQALDAVTFDLELDGQLRQTLRGSELPSAQALHR